MTTASLKARSNKMQEWKLTFTAPLFLGVSGPRDMRVVCKKEKGWRGIRGEEGREEKKGQIRVEEKTKQGRL